jgi:predicted glycosyltransferase
LPDGFEATDEVPVADLYPRAARIISAAGFNVMCETAAWADKHHVVPFWRRFDDQYLRASRRRSRSVC